MNYFITGATGFDGGQVTRHLTTAGHKLVAVVRNPGKASNLAELGVTLVKGGITD